MSAGWKVGDLAVVILAVTESELANGGFPSGGDPMAKGEVHRVTRMVRDWEGNVGIGFDGPQSGYPTGEYLASAFRKIKPDQHEDCEPEFVTLLNRIKRPAKQGETA